MFILAFLKKKLAFLRNWLTSYFGICIMRQYYLHIRELILIC